VQEELGGRKEKVHALGGWTGWRAGKTFLKKEERAGTGGWGEVCWHVRRDAGTARRGSGELESKSMVRARKRKRRGKNWKRKKKKAQRGRCGSGPHDLWPYTRPILKEEADAERESKTTEEMEREALHGSAVEEKGKRIKAGTEESWRSQGGI